MAKKSKNKPKFESDDVIEALLHGGTEDAAPAVAEATDVPSEALSDLSMDISELNFQEEEAIVGASDDLLAAWAGEETSEVSLVNVDVAAEDFAAVTDDHLGAVEIEEPVIGSEDNELASFESAEVVELEEVSNARMLSILESLLFASDRPLSFEMIKQAFKGTSIKAVDIRKGLDDLAQQLAESHRGVSLDEVASGFQLRTKLDNVDFLRRSVKKQQIFRLSGPALEVLSIVAYKQPVVKAEIDQIRGVESGHLMRALMDRGLIRFAGRTELPGKPMSYETAKKFLELFGLRNLKELPSTSEMDQLIPEGIGETPVEEKQLSDLTGALSLDVGQTYSDAEEELHKISSEITGIETMTTFFEDEAKRKKEEADRDRAQDIRDRLVMGEATDPKDVRWLEKYERSLQEKAAKSLPVTAIEEAIPQADALPPVEAEAEQPATDDSGEASL